ncbi:MAG: hypothetical protein NC432_09925 [Roseburia sp.]|nr:hypothetical protein [Roseburia sp.]MCM1098924.1 hypothetical protein [Ruminococcus flavefaciens]MCM1237695.1 hypothetical protein [Ruminococcus flavefaciens]
MAKITSAYASKLLKQLSEDKEFWVNKENSSCLYTAAEGEEPVIPEYDYETVAGKIEELDARICRIKHAVNLANVTSVLEVNGGQMSVDMVLVRMAQLNKRKTFLDYLRKQLPKARTEEHVYSARKMAPEYRYINYDLEKIKSEYERISTEIMNLQIALDKYNQTFEFEVEL